MEVNVEVVEAVVDVGRTNTVSTFVVWLEVANLTNVDIVEKAVPIVVKVFPAVVKLTTWEEDIVVENPAVVGVVIVDHATVCAVVGARKDSVVAMAFAVVLVAEVIVFTVVWLINEVGSSSPILLFEYSVNHTLRPVALLIAKAKAWLPLLGRLNSVMYPVIGFSLPILS